MNWLKGLIVFAFFISLGSLSFLILKARSFGKRRFFSEPAGSSKRGIFYALTWGMMPWEKESATKNVLSYFAGIFFHLGIFGSFFFLFSLIFSLRIPTIWLRFLQFLFLLGLVCGIGLLLKRIFLSFLRQISTADDFFSSVLVNVFLLLSFLTSLFGNLTPSFYLLSIFLFLYIPLGKIRHCFFFFYSRVLLGSFFGRRGVLPPRRG